MPKVAKWRKLVDKVDKMIENDHRERFRITGATLYLKVSSGHTWVSEWTLSYIDVMTGTKIGAVSVLTDTLT